MKRIKRMLAMLLALVAAVSLVACGAQKDNGDANANGDGAAEEKKLVIYSPATDAQVNAVVPLFEERYGIEVEVITGGTGELLARIDAEGDAPYCDVVFGGGESSYSEYKHVFQDYVSPEDANLIESCRNTLGYCTNYNLDCAILMYNTDLIGDIEINGYADLLNPALKGKIVFADPQASSSSFEHLVNMLYAMGTDGQPNGWDYVKEFCKQLPNGCVNSSSAVYKGVADGEYTVGLTFEQGAATYVSQGNIKVVYMNEGVIIRGDGVYIVKDCPNVVSARAFLDWLTGYDAQVYMNETQFRRTIRKDVPETNAMQSMSSINVIKDDETVASEHKREWIEMFQEALVDAAE